MSVFLNTYFMEAPLKMKANKNFDYIVDVPEPSSIAFKLAFPWISLLFSALALNLVGAWSL